jgi:hypothetical protein
MWRGDHTSSTALALAIIVHVLMHADDTHQHWTLKGLSPRLDKAVLFQPVFGISQSGTV